MTAKVGFSVSDALKVDAVFLGVCACVCVCPQKRLFSGILVVNVNEKQNY